jgi:hypothetical protein
LLSLCFAFALLSLCFRFAFALLSLVRFVLCFRFAFACSLCAFALCFRFAFVVASDNENKGIYINFYIDTKVLEHIYPDILFLFIFIFL